MVPCLSLESFRTAVEATKTLASCSPSVSMPFEEVCWNGRYACCCARPVSSDEEKGNSYPDLELFRTGQHHDFLGDSFRCHSLRFIWLLRESCVLLSESPGPFLIDAIVLLMVWIFFAWITSFPMRANPIMRVLGDPAIPRKSAPVGTTSAICSCTKEYWDVFRSTATMS